MSCGGALPGDVAKPYVLDGAERFVTVPRVESIGQQFSYTFWAMPSEPDEIDGVTFGIENTGYFNQHYVIFPEHGGDKKAGTGVSLGTNYVGVYEHRTNFFNARIAHAADLKGWHHYAVVYDHNACTLFIDGVKVGEAPALGTETRPWFSIGKVFGGNKPFKGELDEFCLWSKALTQLEVSKILADKVQGDEAGLEIYYDFDDLSTLPGITDLSGKERHGNEQGYTHAPPADTARVSALGYSKLVEVNMEGARESMAYAIDRLTETSVDIEMAGWAFLPGKDALAQETFVLLRGKKDFFFTTEVVKRNDLTQIHSNNLDDCGFQARIKKADLPPDRYKVWLFIVKQNYWRQFHPTQYEVVVK